LLLLAPLADAVPDTNRHYTFIYFENGYPTRLSGSRRAQSMANRFARENPDVVVQTGFYSLRFDCDTMQLSGYDAVQGSDYLEALNENPQRFSPAMLSLRMEKDGVKYICTSAMVQSRDNQLVRLIESGRFVQRFDLVGLVFTASNGAVLDGYGRLEITAWADHAVFTLDLSGIEGVDQTGIMLVSPAGKTHVAVEEGDRAVLALEPHLDRVCEPLKPSSLVHESTVAASGKAVRHVFDEEEHALRFDLPMERFAYPKDAGRMHEFVIELRNPSGKDTVLPLVFNELSSQEITGTSMLLCEDSDGRPTGIPVQVSKNWHNEKGHRVKHDGPWIRGYSMVPLKAGERRRLRLRVVTGFWGNVPAVSYAQLSVIGYGGNWKWDESALGSWGESMCYDPSQHLGASFITDVRPAFTFGKSTKPYQWTENVGGGDFLVYFDRDNTYRWAKRLKTAYLWTGPNMTEVHYSGITDDEKIRFNYRIRSVRTADYHRRFHAFKYEFLKDVEAPKRLVFHQMAADYYNSAKFERYFVGQGGGAGQELRKDANLSGYAAKPIPFNDAWISIDDTAGGSDDLAGAHRGMLSIQSTLNGRPFPVYLHSFGRGRNRTSFDLAPESVGQSYSAGDVVQGELEFVMPAKSTPLYWGADREFAGRLEAYGDNAWQAVADEQAHNLRMQVSVGKGTLLQSYPLEIRAADGEVLADFSIDRGGIGHVPVILRDVPSGRVLRAERYTGGTWVPLESVDIAQNSYYQGIRNPHGGMDCVFNIARPSPDLSKSWRVRIVMGTE
jgi:hypothetical protein